MSIAISLANLLPDNKKSLLNITLVKALDALLGIRQMNRLYQQHQMAGLPKEQFAQRLLDVMNISIDGIAQLQQRIPKSGPLVIASNHPFGGIEGVILSLVIGQVRPDLKVLANQGLKLFPELSDYFIFTNPLSEKNPKNGPSLRTSKRHLQSGGALLIFPAGRVSYYQSEKQRISEHQWNRIVAHLTTKTGANYLSVFVSGSNSLLFYRLGRIYYRLRLLMLARELLNKRDSRIKIDCGFAVPAGRFSAQRTSEEQAQVCRALSYAQDPAWRWQWPEDPVSELKPLAAPINRNILKTELASLPYDQCLLEHKDYQVFYGYQHQLPATVREIARLRELVFREHNEGSGEPLDTDNFDATYTQLFVVNRKTEKIIGAYRMGRTDLLLEKGDIKQLYLARMFKFSDNFVNQKAPCLELGRSFLIPEYQKSFQGLYLLWRGIGAFVCKYPQYRTLYGTVSLSKLYDPKSVALIKQTLITPTQNVKPFTEFSFELHPELQELANTSDLKDDLSAFMASIEPDGKDIPVLAKHYMKLGARFHCLGIDSNFNDTPGLLLSVNLPDAPEKLLKLYMGESYKDYLSPSG